MKPVLLFLFFLLTIQARGQMSSEPFKGANIILIETNMEGSEAFIKWGRHLARSGYFIDKSDSTFWTLSTSSKETSKLNAVFYIISAVTDKGLLMIKIRWSINVANYTYGYWKYNKGKNNVAYIIYNDFINVINTFGDFIVKYDKRK